MRMNPPGQLFSSAVAWSYLMDGGRELISVLVTLMLAGLLGPKAFGTVAMALLYVVFIEMLQRQGLLSALIQRRNLEDDHADTAFWFILAASSFLTAASVYLSGWWADVNDMPDLQAVVVALSALLPLNALVIVQEALMRRQLRFKELAVRTNTATLVGGLAGVALAFGGAGVWALVGQQLVTATLSLVILWYLSEWRPNLRFSVAAARDLAGFSSGAMLSGIAVFVNNRSDALLVGLMFGPVSVGLYRFAGRLIEMLIGVSGRALASVSLPELARLQDHPSELRSRVEDVLRLSTLSTVPLLGIAAACAQPLLRVMGERWADAAVPLQILCVVGVVRAVQVADGPLLQAVGRPHLQAVLTWAAAAMSAGTFVVAGLAWRGASDEMQVAGIALSRALLYLIVLLPVSLSIIRAFSGVGTGVAMRIIVSPAAAAVTAIVAVAVVRLATGLDDRHAVIDLGASAAVAGTVSLMTLLAIDPTIGEMSRRWWQRAQRHSGAAGKQCSLGATGGSAVNMEEV